jgi:hypothetical protein
MLAPPLRMWPRVRKLAFLVPLTRMMAQFNFDHAACNLAPTRAKGSLAQPQREAVRRKVNINGGV